MYQEPLFIESEDYYHMEICKKKILFVGIGGMGMAPLAIYARLRGLEIYGYDDAEILPFIQSSLEKLHIPIIPLESFLKKISEVNFDTLACDWVKNFDEIVYSTAILSDHFIRKAAVKSEILCTQRGIFLSRIVQDRYLIAVTGSHGKTTTTGMLINLIPHSDYILGGFFDEKDKELPAHYNPENKLIICEVDESDGTIENFFPSITLTLNLDEDHLVNYKNINHRDAVFSKLYNQTTQAIFIPQGEKHLGYLTQGISNAKVIKFSTKGNFFKDNLSAAHQVVQFLGQKHQLSGIKKENHSNKNCLSKIFRRNTFLGKLNGVNYIADYAHHPREIEAFLDNFIKEQGQYLDVIFFQPHRYSRTHQYFKDFVELFSNLLPNVKVYLLPVYSAGETPITQGDSESLAQAIREISPQSKNLLLENDDQLFATLEHIANEPFNQNEKNVLFIGAGNIFQKAEDFIKRKKTETMVSFLTSKSIAFERDANMSHRNSWQVKTTSVLLIHPQSIEQLKDTINQLKILALPFLNIGLGSNLLLDDPSIVYIALSAMGRNIVIDENGYVDVQAGCNLRKFCKELASYGWAGCEDLSGIPGSIGGALYMNAGAHGQEIFDYLESLQILNWNLQVQDIKKENISYSYRKGFQNGIILSAKFKFTQKEKPELILAHIEEKRLWRIQKQPTEPNAGSVFKNPIVTLDYCEKLTYPSLNVFEIDGEKQYVKLSAGQLIELMGLKGSCCGGASVSAKHANFIVNSGKKALPIEIKNLIRWIQFRVFLSSGIFLEREILFASECSVNILNSSKDEPLDEGT